MKTLRRHQISNTDYFLTVVTHARQPILLRDIGLFWECWSGIQPIAWAILPDHFHCIVNNGNSTISDIVRLFKIRYSRRFRDRYRSGPVWQNRFWDHVIRDQDDKNHHVDYIHFNPVKHGLVPDPFRYEYSSIQKWLESGHYLRDWGVQKEFAFDGDYVE